jgi:hypothetical protein
MTNKKTYIEREPKPIEYISTFRTPLEISEQWDEDPKEGGILIQALATSGFILVLFLLVYGPLIYEVLR